MTDRSQKANLDETCRFLAETAGIFLLVLIPGLAWIFSDQTVWPWDPAWYGEVSIALYRALRVEPAAWPATMIAALGFKAPGIAWFGQFFVPIRKITGSFESALLLLPLFASALSAVLIHLTLIRLWPRERAACLAASLFAVSSPLFVGLSHLYFVESIQLLAVCGLLWAVTTLTSGFEIAVSAAFFFCLGLAAKVSSPLYMAFPLLISACLSMRALLRRPDYPLLSAVLTTALLLLGGATATWYLHNWSSMSNFLASTSSGDVALLYGSRADLVTKIGFWATASGGAFFADVSIGGIWCAALGAYLFLALVRVLRKRGTAHAGNHLAALLVVASIGQILLTLFIFSLQVNEETRYLLPLLPYLAILTVVMAIQAGKLGRILALTGATVHVLLVCVINLGVYDLPDLRRSVWLYPPRQDSSSSRLLRAAVHTTCSASSAGSYHVIGLELPQFNANSASFYMAQEQLANGQTGRCYYTSLGYAESDVEKAWKRLEDLRAVNVIYQSRLIAQAANPFNAVSGAVRQKLKSSPNVLVSAAEGFPELEIYKVGVQ